MKRFTLNYRKTFYFSKQLENPFHFFFIVFFFYSWNKKTKTRQQCYVPPIWLFETIERNQSKGLILSRFSCSGQRDYGINDFESFCLHRHCMSSQNGSHWCCSSWAVFAVYAVLSTSRMCHVRDYLTVCKESIATNRANYEKNHRYLIDHMYCTKQAILHINQTCISFFVIFFAFCVKFSIKVAKVDQLSFTDDSKTFYFNFNYQIFRILSQNQIWKW